MNKPTLEEKQSFTAKVRARNYAASLRLEGMMPCSIPTTATSKETLLNKYRTKAA